MVYSTVDYLCEPRPELLLLKGNLHHMTTIRSHTTIRSLHHHTAQTPPHPRPRWWPEAGAW